MEREAFVLEDNKKYVPLKETILNGIKYYLLCNAADKKDICVRKEVFEDGNIYISMLDSEEELQSALQELQK